MRRSARAERRAASSQIGWPDGASAVCGSESPSASPTTCAVAAVPRNWHPPPGLAQARQPMSAAYSSVICCWAKRAPMVCTLPASSPSSGSSVTPPGTSIAGSAPADASAIIIAGRPLSQVATPSDAFAGRKRPHEAAQHHGRIVAIGQRIHHARGALGAPVTGIGACPGKGHCVQRLQFTRGLGDQQADFVVPGVKAKSDGAPVFAAQAAMGTEDQEFRI